MPTLTRKPMPRSAIALIVLWNLVIGGILVTVLVRQQAWGFLVVFVVGAATCATVMVLRRRSIAPRQTTSTSGSPLALAVPVLSGEPDRRWVGSGSFPGWFGTMEASTPLAVLEVFGRALRLRVRPRLVGRMFGMEALVANDTDVEEVFAAFRVARIGIGFRPRNGPTYYLWTSQRDDVLSTLESLGFPVTWQPRKRDRRS